MYTREVSYLNSQQSAESRRLLRRTIRKLDLASIIKHYYFLFASGQTVYMAEPEEIRRNELNAIYYPQ